MDNISCGLTIEEAKDLLTLIKKHSGACNHDLQSKLQLFIKESDEKDYEETLDYLNEQLNDLAIVSLIRFLKKLDLTDVMCLATDLEGILRGRNESYCRCE